MTKEQERRLFDLDHFERSLRILLNAESEPFDELARRVYARVVATPGLVDCDLVYGEDCTIVYGEFEMSPGQPFKIKRECKVPS